MFARPRLPASARAVSTIPATGSVYITDPVGPTMPEIASDGSPLPPPISSTFWPIPIRASLTRPDVNGSNICTISVRCLSQCRAEVSHASRALFCSSGVILVRRKLTPIYFGSTEATILSERGSFRSRSNIVSSTGSVQKWRPVHALLRLGHDPHVWLGRLPALGIAPLLLLLGNRTRDDHVLAWFPIDRRSHLVRCG